MSRGRSPAPVSQDASSVAPVPQIPPPRPDELGGLLGFLEWQRHGVRAALDGLSDAQARSTPVPSTTLSLGGILKHLVGVERSWIRTDVLGGPEEPSERSDDFTLREDQTVAEYLQRWDDEAAHTEQVLRAGLDLDQPVPDPGGAPDNNVRWVLLHLIEETARHAGHADIIREAIDGRKYRR